MQEDYVFNTGEFEEVEEGLSMRIFTADFETTTDPDDCRVWAYAVCDVRDTDFVVYGNSIEDFIEWCNAAANCQLYFHNLGFDGAFILDYLEKNGWEWVEDNKHVKDKSYTTLISDMNQVYQITLYFTKEKRVKIYDSFKVIPLSVKRMAKDYGLDEGKGELDYEAYREVGHVLTDAEKDYIRRDVQIVAHVLVEFIDEGLTKMTAGSNALYTYKKMLGGDKGFRKMYPEITEEEDAFIRKAYRGGFTYADPRFSGKEIGEGIVFDVNSLYPSVMHDCKLPYGSPEWFDGKPPCNPKRPLWVAAVSCRFKVKKNHIPCIQLKGNFRFKQTEYLEKSGVEVVFTVTNVDWTLINMQYDIKNVEWLGGYTFKANEWQFKEYVDKFTEQKIQAAKEGKPGKRQIAKLMLNSLYGKFATRIEVKGRRPMLDEDGVVRYTDMEAQKRKPVYLPVGVFVTAYARFKTVSSAQSVYDRFLYADTDSLHLLGTDIPSNLDVDPFRLGAWKHESTFTRAKFLRAKCYTEEIDGELETHVSGMPYNLHDQVTMDNFDFGAVYDGKLYQKRVPGGIVLVPGEMQIRE